MFGKVSSAITLMLSLAFATSAALADHAAKPELAKPELAKPELAKPELAKPELAKPEDSVTDYFGTKVTDPYRWMEGGAENARLTEFLKNQNTYTRSVLHSLKSRDALLARIQQLDNAVPTVRSWQRGGTNLFVNSVSSRSHSSGLVAMGGLEPPTPAL